MHKFHAVNERYLVQAVAEAIATNTHSNPRAPGYVSGQARFVDVPREIPGALNSISSYRARRRIAELLHPTACKKFVHAVDQSFDFYRMERQ